MTKDEPARRPRSSGWVRFFWDKHVRVEPSESRGHDADQSPGRAAEDKCLVQDLRILIEPSHPGFVAQHKHRRRPGFVVGGLQHTAEQRRHAKKFKSARSDMRSVEPLGALGHFVKYFFLRGADDAVENMV